MSYLICHGCNFAIFTLIFQNNLTYEQKICVVMIFLQIKINGGCHFFVFTGSPIIFVYFVKVHMHILVAQFN